jgi:hypothetical protein
MSKSDVAQLLTKVLEIFDRNFLSIKAIAMKLDHQFVRSSRDRQTLDEGDIDAFMVQLWRARGTLSKLVRILRQQPKRRRPANMRLHGTVTRPEDYWKSLGRKRTIPWKLLEAVMKFIDPAAVCKLQSAKKHRVKVSAT